MFDPSPRHEESPSGPAIPDPAIPGGGATAGAGDGVDGGARHVSLGAAAQGLSALRGLDVSTVADGELLSAVASVEAAQRSLDVLRCHLVGELDVRGVTDVEHGQRTHAWLAGEAQLPRRVARRWVRLGRALRRLPALDAAFVEGQVGVEQVAVLVRLANPRIADALDAAVPALIEDLHRTSFEVWQAEVEAFARLIDDDGPTPEERPSSVSLRPVGDEQVLKGHFSGLEGEALAQAIESVTDELYRRAVSDAKEAPGDLPVPARNELRARAVIELVRRGLASAHRGPGAAPELSLVLHAHATGSVDLPGDPGDPGGPGEDTERARGWPSHGCGVPGCADTLDLDVDIDVDRSPLPRHPVELRGPRGTYHRLGRDHWLFCDPLVAPVVLDGLGVPLDVGRASRYATPEQRRALAARDGGCVFPGCDAPVAWCDAHHVIPWDDGGVTDIPNLALLCRYHHGVTHRRGWTMTTTTDQWFTWSTPTGATLRSQRHHTRAGPPDPA